MTEKQKNIINRRFNKTFKKVILFRNPNEFNHIVIEKINPNHIGILWGRRKKKLNKGTNYIRLGKVYFPMIQLALSLSVIGYHSVPLLLVFMFYSMLITSIWYLLFHLPLVVSKRFTPCGLIY